MKKSVIAAVVILVVAILYAAFVFLPMFLFHEDKFVDEKNKLDSHWHCIDWGNVSYNAERKFWIAWHINTSTMVEYKLSQNDKLGGVLQLVKLNPDEFVDYNYKDGTYKSSGILYGNTSGWYDIRYERLDWCDFTIYEWVNDVNETGGLNE